MGAVNRDRVLGSLAGYPDGFAEDLARQGCSSSAARSHGQLMQHLSWWMACSGLAVSDSDMVGVDEYLRWRRETDYVRGLTREQIEPVIGYLRRVGAAPPLPDPASGMPLLTRRVHILGQPPAHRALIHPQHRSGPLRNLPHRRDRIGQRRAHRASVHPVPLRQLPDRATLIPVLTSDTFELLHPRSPSTPHTFLLAMADETERRGWNLEGGAKSSHHYRSKWGHFRLAHSVRCISTNSVRLSGMLCFNTGLYEPGQRWRCGVKEACDQARTGRISGDDRRCRRLGGAVAGGRR